MLQAEIFCYALSSGATCVVEVQSRGCEDWCYEEVLVQVALSKGLRWASAGSFSHLSSGTTPCFGFAQLCGHWDVLEQFKVGMISVHQPSGVAGIPV